MSIISNLLVKLGLDKESFDKGIDQSKKKAGEMGTASDQAGQKVSGMGGIMSTVMAKVAIAVGAAVAAFKIFETVVKSNQATGDKFEAATKGMGNALEFVKVSLATMNFTNFIDGLKEAYDAGKLAAEMMDELFERTLSFNIQTSKTRVEIAKLNIELRNRNLTDEERLEKGYEILRLTDEMATQEKELVQQELDAAKLVLQSRTGLSDESIKFMVDEYNANRNIINAAREYNDALEQRAALEKAYFGKENVLEQSKAYAALNKTIANAKLVPNIEAVADMVKQYDRSNDEIVANYANTAAKINQIDEKAVQSIMRAQTQIYTLQAEQTAERLAREEEAQKKAAEAQANQIRTVQEEIALTLDKLTEAKIAAQDTSDVKLFEQALADIDTLTKRVYELRAKLMQVSGASSLPDTLTQSSVDSMASTDGVQSTKDEISATSQQYFDNLYGAKQHEEAQGRILSGVTTFGEELNNAIDQAMKGAVISLAGGLGELAAGAITGEDFGKQVLTVIGNFMMQVGAAFITLSSLWAAFEASIASMQWYVAVGIGVALVAAGAAVKSLAKKGVSAGASGGKSAGGGGGVSEAKARDPYVYNIENTFTPAFADSRQSDNTVVFEIEGDKLVGVLRNYERKQGRMR